MIKHLKRVAIAVILVAGYAWALPQLGKVLYTQLFVGDTNYTLKLTSTTPQICVDGVGSCLSFYRPFSRWGMGVAGTDYLQVDSTKTTVVQLNSTGSISAGTSVHATTSVTADDGMNVANLLTFGTSGNKPLIAKAGLITCSAGVNDGSLDLGRNGSFTFCDNGFRKIASNLYTGNANSSITPTGTINANSCTDFSVFTVFLSAGAYPLVAPASTPDAGITFSAWVTTNVLNLRLCNATTSNITLAGTVTYNIWGGGVSQ